LEHALRDLPTTGTLVKGRAYREVWRFEIAGRGHYLKFDPRRGKRLKRLLRGDPAMREFLRLQWLQKAGIPAPRAVAVLKGFRLGPRVGDAVILEAIEPAVPLDRLLHTAELEGKQIEGRREIARQVIEIVRALAKANLGHVDLHLGNFLVKGQKVYLLDAYAVRRGGVRMQDLMLLGHSAARYATRGEILRGWRELGPAEAAAPAKNLVSGKLWRKMAGRAVDENDYFARLTAAGWTGYGFLRTKFPYPWSRVSALTFEPADLQRAWADLVGRIERGDVSYLKQSESGDVMAADIEIGGRRLAVVAKAPRRKQWHRYFTDVLRGDRALRAWVRAWELIARDIPTAWPIMIMRRTAAGYPLESVIVFERVEGVPLTKVDLDALPSDDRELLFRRVGRLLRRIDESGYYHRDAKSDNVMVERGNVPVLVDLDGIRELTFGRWSLPRMLTSMKLHKQYTPADSMSLCKGYAPYAHVEAEQAADEGGEA
jgi:tRNA A-37 threonylcarbamoyl transferase component Bud32